MTEMVRPLKPEDDELMSHFHCYRCGLTMLVDDLLGGPLLGHPLMDDVASSCDCPDSVPFPMAAWFTYSGAFDVHCHYPANWIVVTGSTRQGLMRDVDGHEKVFSLK